MKEQTASYAVGIITASIGGTVLGFVIDAFSALVFGALGAAGAYLFNRYILKRKRHENSRPNDNSPHPDR